MLEPCEIERLTHGSESEVRTERFLPTVTEPITLPRAYIDGDLASSGAVEPSFLR